VLGHFEVEPFERDDAGAGETLRKVPNGDLGGNQRASVVSEGCGMSLRTFLSKVNITHGPCSTGARVDISRPSLVAFPERSEGGAGTGLREEG
jgi:hypothetical protein